MTQLETLLDEIKKKAKKASKEWVEWPEMGLDLEVNCGPYCQGGTAYIDFGLGRQATYEDGEYIARMDPQTTLALLEVVRAAHIFYLSRKLIENQKEVDWLAFDKLGENLENLAKLGQRP